MQADVLVVGGGIAGIAAAAAAAAAEESPSVVLVRRGLGATAVSSGAIDLAPDLYARPGEVVLAAAGLAGRTTVTEHIERVLVHRPLHPYSILGLRAPQVAAAAAWLHGAIEEGTLEWRGEDRPPFLVLDAAGEARAADLCPGPAAAGDLRGLKGTRVAVADFGDDLPGWDAAYVARALGAVCGEASVVQAVPMRLPSGVRGAGCGAASTHELALAVDADEGASFAEAAAVAVRGGGWSHLMLPPAVGLDRSRGSLIRLGDATGAIPFEAMPTGPPSVPGLRLQRALDRVAEAAGVSLREGRCEGFDAEQGRITRVRVAPTGPEADPDLAAVEPRVVILCTGRFIGGGLRWERRPGETVFGLPVRVGDRFPDDAPPSRFADPGHDPRRRQPVFAAGVAVGDDLRPLGPGGHVAYGNLYAAGAVVAGHDDGAERGGAGLALVTGWIAGRAAARASRR